jgi:mRNA-degrading endonuclease HigB of HigAB toxin-antitoxin module
MKTSLKIIKMVSVSCMVLFGMFLTACDGGGGTTVPTYTVGGTVSGLSGTLVLQNNGGDDLTIASNGAFTFATPLANSASYDVTILTSPINQNCTCTNGTGIICEANVSDVEVTCVNKGWTHPFDLTDNISPDAEDASVPKVAMDRNGNAIITWLESDGSNDQIFMSEYRSGTWSHPLDLADNISPNGQHAYNPQVAMDNNGNAIITWEQSDGSNVQIFKSEYRSGGWTHPANLADNISPNGQNARYPEVAMDNNGNAIIAWYQSDGSNKQIFMSEYRSGTWSHPLDLADNISPDGQDAYDPQVAMDDNGNAIIAWYQSDGTKMQIFMSEYRSGGWAYPADLADNISPDGEHVSDPQVAMDDNGNAIITWAQSDGSNWQIFKSEYRSGGWSHPASLADNISPDGQDAYIVCSPQVAMDDNGNAIITWEHRNGSNWQIFKSEYRNGTWTHPAGLADNISPDGQIAYYPSVAMGNNGNAIITWAQSDGINEQIFISEYR